MRLLLSVNQCALLRAFFFPASKSPSAGTGRRSRAWVIATQFLMMFFFRLRLETGVRAAGTNGQRSQLRAGGLAKQGRARVLATAMKGTPEYFSTSRATEGAAIGQDVSTVADVRQALALGAPASS